MAQRLDKRTSGTRHLQWGKQIHATLLAHLEFNDTLSDPQRAALEEEKAILEADSRPGGQQRALPGLPGRRPTPTSAPASAWPTTSATRP